MTVRDKGNISLKKALLTRRPSKSLTPDKITSTGVQKPYSPVAGIIIVGIALFVVAAFLLLPVYQVFDERGMPMHYSEGIVTWVSMTGANSFHKTVFVTVDSHQAYFSWQEGVKAGERFSLEYRVGRSGHVYIESARPFLPY